MRLAAGSTSCESAALIVPAPGGVRVAAMVGEEFPTDLASLVATEVIEATKRRFVCDVKDDLPVFVAAEPVVNLHDEVAAVICVAARKSMSASPELWGMLKDIARLSLTAVTESVGGPARASRADKVFSFVGATLQSINTGVLNLEDVTKLVLDQSVRLTSGFAAVVGFIDGNHIYYTSASPAAAAIRGLRVPVANSPAGACMASGRMMLSRDAQRDRFVEDWAARGAHSLAALPLHCDGATVGTLTVLADRVNAFRPADVHVLDQLAMLLAASVERSRAHEALNESESRYQALVQQTAEAIYFADPHTGKVLEANPAFFKLLGFGRDELPSLSLDQFVDHDADDVARLLAEVLSKRVMTLERRWISRSGRRIFVQATISVIRHDGRDVIFVVARDVTLQKQAEAARRRSERKYRDLFERANVPIMIFRPEGEVVLEANHQALTDYGFTRDELIGRSLRSLTADVRRGEQEMAQIIAQGGTQNFETLHYRKDGTPISLLVSCSLIEYEARPAVLMFGRDITDRKQAERLLSESEARLRAVADHALDLTGIVDQRGRIRYMAGPVEEVLGFKPRDIRGSVGTASHIHPDDLTSVKRAFVECLQHPELVISIEFRILHGSGEWRDLSVKGRNLLNQPGVNGVLLSIRDVTQRKRFEAELVAAKEKAEEMARLKSAFLANMSHEIRTPLTAILGFADVLAKEVEGEHREFVQLIQEGGRRLSETLNSVLDLARLEAGGFQPVLESVDVNAAVQSVAALFEPMAERRGIVLATELDSREMVVEADRGGFNRILQNLLSNAIKFTDSGHVKVTTRRTAGGVMIQVRDTGAGIEEAFLPHLFDEFKQESTGLARSHEGTGLGLTITRRLVELMRGEISVESRKNEGSTFTVCLPATQDDASSADHTPLPPAYQASRTRVLVVEDNVFTRLLVERLLRDDCDVTTAADATDAFAVAVDSSFDIVLMDINLGEGCNGVELMRQLRRMTKFTDVPFVALTAYAMPEDRTRFLADGFNAYLSKPFAKEDLTQTISQMLVP